MNLSGIRDVVGEVMAKTSNLPGDAVSEKVPLYKDSFDKISNLLSKEMKIGSKDASYKQCFLLYQGLVRTSSTLNEAEDTQDTNKLSSIYEEYFKEISKQLEKLGAGARGAVVSGPVGHTLQNSNFQEMTIDEVLASTSSVSHDFGDGNGEVSAHRHKNLDKTEGGWVADTAKVDADVYIGKDAEVSGNAQVLKRSRIMHNTRVSGNAVVSETGMYNNSQVYGNAVLTKSTLRGNAKVYDKAEVAASIICGDSSINGKKELINGRVFNDKSLSEGEQREIGLKLIGAARDGDVKKIEECLQLGADVNTKDNMGWPPFFEAAWNGQGEAIRVLEELGADVNATDNDGKACRFSAFKRSTRR